MTKSTIHKPQDKLFKLAMEEIVVAKEFFSAHLPENVLERIDLTTLEFENNSFIALGRKSFESG